ncbi:MAG: hypothetical protein EXS35_17640 [Pedosphaera sp.]|nr:hypothetical protein [Pedosphaera sp.]
MSKAQYWILNCVGGLCAFLLAANLVVFHSNERSGRALNETQAHLNRAQQIRTTMENLAVRIAQAGQTEPVLRDLLTRHDLKVSLNTNNPAPAKP